MLRWVPKSWPRNMAQTGRRKRPEWPLKTAVCTALFICSESDTSLMNFIINKDWLLYWRIGAAHLRRETKNGALLIDGDSPMLQRP